MFKQKWQILLNNKQCDARESRVNMGIYVGNQMQPKLLSVWDGSHFPLVKCHGSHFPLVKCHGSHFPLVECHGSHFPLVKCRGSHFPLVKCEVDFSQFPFFAWSPDLPEQDWSGWEGYLICLSRINDPAQATQTIRQKTKFCEKSSLNNTLRYLLWLPKLVQGTFVTYGAS